jgi:hypothetical protein
MHPPVSAERWAAIRALREGEPPIFPLLAVATDLHPATIRERASLEGWRKQEFQSRIVRDNWKRQKCRASIRVAEAAVAPADPEVSLDAEQHATRLGDFVARRLGEMISDVEASGGRLDKAQIDALWSMVRTAERSGTLMKERSAENGAMDDAELAARLRRLDDRIVELAQAHAEWLVGEQHRAGMG